MPGQKDKYEGTDPDPSEYLFVSMESKRMAAAKPYDAKKSCWVPHDKEGFVLGEIRAAKGEKVTVFAANKEQVFKKEQVAQVNPPKFEKCEDMSNLTYLNDASVLWNLKDRYYNKLIHTYSGLFCVVVNPYQRYPIYTTRVINMYKGKRRTEVPAHIFAVSDGAYMDMLNNRENQSMLITGESGAGKTENTKKVISYFAIVGANQYKEGTGKKANLEDQVVQTNPVLEAFGNAKTVRNDNSSRFGKFIRIHFASNGKLAGADIETYLLEKARVISQQPKERSYHIFYQIMSGAIPGLKDKLFLSSQWEDYPNQSMGKTEIEGMNDQEEMEITDNCMDVLGFEQEDKLGIYKIVAAVMHLATMKFKQRGREEQAEADGTKEGETVAKLLEIDSDALYRNLLKPKIKVGNEFVTQGRTKDQVFFSVGALCKAMFDKLFKWIVSRCNDTLAIKAKRAFFIGVLDIAGFEIFEFNSFEQLCINFTNEKLQQFFNHHMFVLEQEEYQREGIQWTFIDFGLDLQACIDLIEKPLGIFSILEEESMFPKASDKTFEEKLMNNHMGKSSQFVKPKGGGKDPSKDAHFAVGHYAGTVAYNVTGWLEKNKDPLNETVLDQFRKEGLQIVRELFEDTAAADSASGGTAKAAKRTKGSTFQTVSALYREQVENLMATLRATSPHFIRCIIPNEHKEAGLIDSPLVMHQLTCNGVLEGIRICRKGFPNRMQYKEFKHRYLILASAEMVAAPSDKEAASACFAKINLEEDKYRLGHTKLFFRTGVVAYIEELRDDKIQIMTRSLQAQCRTYLSRKQFKQLVDRREALVVLQRVIRMYMNMRLWLWWKLWSYLRPLLQVGMTEDRIKELEKKIENQKIAMKEEEKRIDIVEKELDRALEEKQKLMMEMEEQRAAMEEVETREAKIKQEARRKDEEIKETQERLQKEEEARIAVEQAKKKAEAEIKNIKREMGDLEAAVLKSEQARQEKEHQLRCLNDEVDQQDNIIARLNKEKRQLSEANQKAAEELQAAEDKSVHLAKLKTKMESSLDEMEDALEREKKSRVDQERYRRKAEADVKAMQQAVEAVERTKKEMEASAARREKELAALADKLGSEQGLVNKAQKQIKECGVRIDDLEEELESERGYRVRAEQQRAEAARELQELQDRLDEAGGATAAQIELNKKREAELVKLKKVAEEATIAREAALAGLRKKHTEAMHEMEEQIETQNRTRQKLERDKSNLQQEIAAGKAANDRLVMDKALLEKDAKTTSAKLTDAQFRLDEASRTLSDLESAKNRLTSENSDLERRLDEADLQMGQLNKMRVSLNNQLADAQKLADDEAKERVLLLSKYRSLESDRENMRQTLEEALEEKADIMRQLARANGDATMWRAKYESESAGKIDELEHAKMKLQARLAEAEDTIEGLNGRCASLEKLKHRLLGEIEDMQMQVDASNQMAISLEKRAKNFDKVVDEWKAKVEELTLQLDESQKENRNVSAELFRHKAALEDSKEQLDVAKKENKNLSLEVKDLLDQIGEGGRSLHEVDRQRRRLEAEKEELAAALDEAEAALEAEENRTIRAQMEVAASRQEIERRVQEKEDEWASARKTLQRLIESLQASLEAESRSKAEVVRTKKKLEADIQELECALDMANRANAENLANARRYLADCRDLRDQLEEERREGDHAREQAASADRRAAAANHEAEEARTLREAADKARRSLEQELNSLREALNDAIANNQSLTGAKRALETELASQRAEVDEAMLAVRNSEEKSRRAALDALRLAEEARREQERANHEEADRRALEAQLKELQMRLEEAEANAIRGGRKVIEKLEARIRLLGADLDMEQRFRADNIKNLRKAERRVKEMQFTCDEHYKSYERLQELNEKLQGKVRTFKSQVEDAEEIAALNLAKFRKAQSECEEAEQRANLAEEALGKVRARSIMRGDTPASLF